MELRPCPFCKSNKVKIQVSCSNYHCVAKAFGRCNKCHARGPLFTKQLYRVDKNKELDNILQELKNKAIKAWNGEEYED